MGQASKHILFIMGVSGSGKSTIGKLLAEALGYSFFDGDDFHPKVNIEKMASGKSLNDEDRYEWLLSLNELAKKNLEKGAVIACSALKESYRDLLQNGIGTGVEFIYLKGSFQEILERLQQRKDHYMPVELLRSQFETLSPPKNAIVVAISQPPEIIVNSILTTLESRDIN
ncbi:gluconokinase [Flavobacteriaceae bacterium KMM 6897]|nr:gluconokinase [Flavobacteriaceae bacterium KMM 6897]MEB8345679.1 gluconokinase [Flavobacteriaceae bacterium KMM 6898]